jgi:large subunit ribosomal protein L30
MLSAKERTMTKLKVTLKRSVIGSTKSQQATVRGLGLRKIRSSKVLINTPAVRGMIKKVIHLLDVEEVTE